MTKVKKKSRKKKKQVQREQKAVCKIEKRPSGTEKIYREPCGLRPENEKTNITKGQANERPHQGLTSLSSLKTPDGEQSLWQNLLVVIFLSGLAFAIYSNTLNVPFVFDDRYNITDNPTIRITELSFKSLLNSALEGKIRSRPLSNVSIALNYYFNGFEVPGYHTVNIAIHAITGILLYFLFRITLRTPALRKTSIMPKIAAFAAATIWLAHPLQTQSVTYVIQRMNSMATMFYLLAMLLYVIARLSMQQRMKVVFFAGCTLSGLAGFGTKEIVITLPFFILLYEFYFLQDLDIKWLKSRTFIIAAMLIIFGAVMLAGQAPNSIFSFNGRQFTMGQRLLTEARVVIFYISQLFFPNPSRLNLFHDFSISLSIIQPLTTLASILALASLLGIAVWRARQWRLLSFCILWYLGNLVLESSVIPLEIIFEHRNYLPSAFICLMFTCIVMRGLNLTRFKMLAFVIFFLITIIFSYWTYDRNGTWRDEETLLTDCLKKAPNVARTEASLGYELMRQWRLEEAIHHFQIALRLNPTSGVKQRILSNLSQINKLRSSPKYKKTKRVYE